MKNLKLKYSVFLMLLAVLVACKPEAPKKKAKLNEVPKKTTIKKKTNKANTTKTAPTKKKSQGDYLNKLKKELSLTDQQFSQLKTINKKYNKQISAIPKINGKKDSAKTKAIIIQKQAEIKKLLGEDLFKKKQAFDKKKKKSSKKK